MTTPYRIQTNNAIVFEAPQGTISLNAFNTPKLRIESVQKEISVFFPELTTMFEEGHLVSTFSSVDDIRSFIVGLLSGKAVCCAFNTDGACKTCKDRGYQLPVRNSHIPPENQAVVTDGQIVELLDLYSSDLKETRELFTCIAKSTDHNTKLMKSIMRDCGFDYSLEPGEEFYCDFHITEVPVDTEKVSLTLQVIDHTFKVIKPVFTLTLRLNK